MLRPSAAPEPIEVLDVSPIEDDAILMEDGVQFLHPANYRLLVVK